MKYFKEDIERTTSMDYFKDGFIKEGVCYNMVNDGLVKSLVNYTKIIKSYVCEKYSIGDDLELLVDKDTFLNKIRKLNIENVTIHYNVEFESKYVTLKFRAYDDDMSRLEDWVTARNVCSTHRSELGAVDEEIMLCKVEDLDNVYVFFWFSKTKDNSICKFTTNDNIDVIIKEFEEYLDKIGLKTRYEILPENYNGWLGQ